MTCSDFLPTEGRNCARTAAYLVEIGSRSFPKCAIHARRYQDNGVSLLVARAQGRPDPILRPLPR